MSVKQVDWSKEISGLQCCLFASYAVIRDGKLYASVNFKFPKDGAGRLTAQYHVLGEKLMQGSASGYGYDKKTAALEGARFGEYTIQGNGWDWDRQLQDAGFEVHQTL
jgi:hypothetical protein